MRFPKLGEIRVHEHTGRLSRMLTRGRFHAYAAAFRYERGRWVVSRGRCGVPPPAPLHPPGRRSAPVPGRGRPRSQDHRGRRGRERTPAAGVRGGESAAARPGTTQARQPGPRENQEGLGRPSEGSPTPGQDARPGRSSSEAADPQHHHRTRPRVRFGGHRGPQRGWHASTPFVGPARVGRCVRRVPPAVGVQVRLVRHRARRRGPVVPVQQDLLGARVHRPGPDAVGPDVRVHRLWPRYRSGPQRRRQPRPLHPGRVTQDVTATTCGRQRQTTRKDEVAAGRQPRTCTPVGGAGQGKPVWLRNRTHSVRAPCPWR